MKSIQIIAFNLFFISLIIIRTEYSAAQSKKITENNQVWLHYYGQAKVSEKWIVFFDGGFRWRDWADHNQQYLVRAAVGYNLNPDVNIAAGLCQSGYYTDDEISRSEFRPFQEITSVTRYNGIRVNNRLRLEERFFNQVVNGEVMHPNTFNFRFRYLLMVGIPIVKLSKQKPDFRLVLNVGDEIFLNAGKQVVNNVFDQNRFMISPTIEFDKTLAVSFIYNGQLASTSKAGTYNFSRVYWLQIRHKLDFTAKKVKE